MTSCRRHTERHAGGGEGVEVITLRRGEDGGLAEDADLRGLHPMIAERLRSVAAVEFALERLPADREDVYLFPASRATTRSDERLFALAEVRDLTPVRDEEGRVDGAARARADARARRSRRSARSRPAAAAPSGCSGTA